MLLYYIKISILKGTTILEYTYIIFLLLNHKPNYSLPIRSFQTFILYSHTKLRSKHLQIQHTCPSHPETEKNYIQWCFGHRKGYLVILIIYTMPCNTYNVIHITITVHYLNHGYMVPFVIKISSPLFFHQRNS